MNTEYRIRVRAYLGNCIIKSGNTGLNPKNIKKGFSIRLITSATVKTRNRNIRLLWRIAF